MSKMSVDKIKRLKEYLHKDKSDDVNTSPNLEEQGKEENTLSREDSNITLIDDSENLLRDKEQEEISIAGSEETLVGEEKSTQEDDEATLVGDEEDLEKKEGLKREDSSESIYFDAIQEEDAKAYIEDTLREELQDRQLIKLLDKPEAKKEEIDDVVLNDTLWSVVNAVGRRYINGFLYEKEYKKMSTAERFIMDKIVDEKLKKYYEQDINQIAEDVNKSPIKKLRDTLNVVRLYFVGKTEFIKDLEKDVNKIKIENGHSKKSMKKTLEKNGIKKDGIMKEVDFLLNQVKNTTLYGGYYYVVFKGIDNITEDISYNAVDSENVVLFDLSDPVKLKGDGFYFDNYKLDKRRMCQGDDLQLKLGEIKRYDNKDIVSNIEHLKERGTYYIVEKGKEHDVPGIDAVYEDSDIKIYDISNPLDLKDGEFYYGDYKLDKNRLLKVEQDRTFEGMMDLLADSEILIKNTVYYLEGTQNTVDFLEYIHIRAGNMEYQEEKEIIEKLEHGISEVKDELIRIMFGRGNDFVAAVARLTDKGRAAGIHLVVATQSTAPETLPAMLTGCFHCGIAFKTDSLESRRLIRSPDADRLCAPGEMLLRRIGLVRAQCAWISAAEEGRIVEELVKRYPRAAHLAEVSDAATTAAPESQQGKLAKQTEEELYNCALEVVRTTKRASISHLQRKIGIGYNHAARLLDLLEERGVVGSANLSHPRRILIS